MTDPQTDPQPPTPTVPHTRRIEPDGAVRILAGRYALLGELGRGGMGIVWRAEDRLIGRRVAIKELRLPEGADEAEVFSERVLREVRTGGGLNDPAVVTVFDVVTEAGVTYIVMELVEAPTLSDVVRAHGPLPPQQVAAIGRQVLAALQAAHTAGIVHRDVKPGNIMVAADGRVKLTDFGIAQAVDDPRLTTSGLIIGSPAYMAPERVRGREALPASDIWSLGTTLFFAVEGTMAFERPTTAATLHAILNEVPVLTRAQGPIASAVMGMLVTSPEARISAPQAQSLLAMAAGAPAATAVHNGPGPTRVAPYTPPAPPTPERSGGGFRRTLLRTGIALAAVLLLVAGLLLGKVIWQPATDSAMLPTLTYGPGGDVPTPTVSTSYDCYNGRLEPGYAIGSNAGVDCDGPHDLELYLSSYVLGTSSPSSDWPVAQYPDQEQARAWLAQRCALSFRSNAVDENARSSLRYQGMLPSAQAWATTTSASGNQLNRLAYCFVSSTTGQLTRKVSQEVR